MTRSFAAGLRGVAALLGVAALAAWLTFSTLQAHHSSDSLIPVLASILHWTPFYWDQDRYGLLIPWLALPFDSPMTKFLVVTGLNAFSSLVAFLAVARVLAGRRAWVSSGFGALFLFLAWAPLGMQASILSPYQFFTTPLVLLSAGILVAQSGLRARYPALAWGVVAGLSCLACWVNMASPLLACMLWIGLCPWRHDVRRDGLLALGTLALGSLTNLALVFTFDHQRVQFRLVPVAFWPESVQAMGRHLWDATRVADGSSPLIAWVTAGLALALLRGGRADDQAHPAAEGGASPRVAWAGVALYAGVIAVQRWTRHGDYSDRFWHPALLVALVLATAVCLRRLPARWRVIGVSVAGIYACQTVHARYGEPGWKVPRQAVEASLGQHTAVLLRGGVTHIAGDYWQVWPAVFAANLARYEEAHAAGLPMEPVWGLASRSVATRERLMQRPPGEWRVAVLPPEPLAVSLEALGLPPVRVDRVEHGVGWGSILTDTAVTGGRARQPGAYCDRRWAMSCRAACKSRPR